MAAGFFVGVHTEDAIRPLPLRGERSGAGTVRSVAELG
jgi:hypothetical protein